MSQSRVSSLHDIDIEKLGGRDSPPVTLRADSPPERDLRSTSRGPRRPHSRNFSRPSLSSLGSYDSIQRRRSPSDDEKEIVQTSHYKRSRSVDELTTSPASARVPVFAQKAIDAMLRQPPPVMPPSPGPPSRQSRRSETTRSIDVMEAVKHLPPDGPWQSTRSLMATIRARSKDESSTFAQRVFEAGKPDLMYELRTTKRFKDRRHGVLDITTLQRMNQHVLQQKLTEQVKAIGEKNAWMEIGIKETLHEYCEAVRDLEYAERCASRGTSNDPFLLTTEHPLECKLLEDAGLAFGDPKKKLSQPHPDRLEYTKRESQSRRKLKSLLMSLVGGLALIAPYLILTLLNSQLARLVVTCGFMVVFAIAIALGSEMGPDRIALVTAAYAAALVIFVGNDPPVYQYGA